MPARRPSHLDRRWQEQVRQRQDWCRAAGQDAQQLESVAFDIPDPDAVSSWSAEYPARTDLQLLLLPRLFEVRNTGLCRLEAVDRAVKFLKLDPRLPDSLWPVKRLVDSVFVCSASL